MSPSSGLKSNRAGAPFVRVACICVCVAALAGCTSVLSEMPSAIGGLPQGTPERPATSPAYPAVHDMPPPRPNSVLTEDEKKRVEAELAAIRAEQAKRVTARGQIE
jgi:hypothetical protein